MIKRKLYFKKDGVLFAHGYERVVHGGRGKYVELTWNQVDVELVSRFNQVLPKEITDETFYYYWLTPKGRDEKIYWQCNLVNYADYKIGYLYISPDLLEKFDEPKDLF
ncbi:MAG: hypothetical protein ACOC22_02970 [bacterium]